MFTFRSPADLKKTWKLYLKSPKEMIEIFYEDTEPEDGCSVNGITEFPTSKVYINKNINGFLLKKTIIHELMHIYLWDSGKNKSYYSADEVSEIFEVAAPLICKIKDEVVLKLGNEENIKSNNLENEKI